MKASQINRKDALESISLGNSNQIAILPKGGLLNEFWFETKGKQINVVRGFASEEQLQSELMLSYNSARLTPFPNRINEGKFQFEGQAYQLPINFSQQQHAIHGFLANANYQVSSYSNSELVLKHAYQGDYRGFPFPFTSILIYRFDGKRLSCTSTVTNTGATNLPYAEGWHPYFQLGGKVDDWLLSFPSKAQIEVNERMIPTGVESPYTAFRELTQIGTQHFDSCFLLSQEERRADTIIQQVDIGIQLCFSQEQGKGKYNYLQLYTPENRKALAIEPMTAIPDALNNKNGLLTLASNEQTQLNWYIELTEI